jgi:polyisoprenoid-binding protein YceI
LPKLKFIVAGVVALAVLGVVALVAITLLRDDDPDLKTEAPSIPAADGGATPAASTPVASATPTAGVFRFVVDQSGSEVKYVVREKLARLPVSSDAVGTTKTITGEINLTPQGLAPGTQSKFSVDLRTLRTDESLRDRFVRDNVLQTGRFPNADFVVESISGFPAGYVEGQEVSLTMRGTLTVKGVSKPVEWTVKARRAGDTLSAIADTDFMMSDFGITPPRVPTATSEDGVHLQITLLAKLAPGG